MKVSKNNQDNQIVTNLINFVIMILIMDFYNHDLIIIISYIKII